MKSKIIQAKKKECELNNKVTFTTFTFSDLKSFSMEIGTFPDLEPEFKTGIKLFFTHKISPKESITFMSIVFADTILKHPKATIEHSLQNIVNKRIRLYQGIFQCDYFDFEDQIFPNKVFKVKNN